MSLRGRPAKILVAPPAGTPALPAMTLPTQLSCLRIVLTFLIMLLLFIPGSVAKAAALGGFAAAGLTDWLDGYIARRWNQRSDLGALLDPIADKVLVLGMFLAFVQLRLIPAWMVLIIALRESVITGVRLFAASRQIVLAASADGKQKTVSQMVTIVVILAVLFLKALESEGARLPLTDAAMQWLVLGCLWVTMGLTLISGASFFRRHWAALRHAMGR